MSDLKSKSAIYLKGFLFFAMVLLCAGILIAQSDTWQDIAIILVLIWASARSYYFMFYVIERYVDSSYKFSGVYSFIKYCLSNKDRQESDE